MQQLSVFVIKPMIVLVNAGAVLLYGNYADALDATLRRSGSQLNLICRAGRSIGFVGLSRSFAASPHNPTILLYPNT